MNKYILLFFVFILNKYVISQSDISWIAGSNECVYSEAECWDPSLPTSSDNILLTSTQQNIIELQVDSPKELTYSSVQISGNNKMSVQDTSLIVTNAITLSGQSTLRIQITDDYFTALTKKPASQGSIVLLNASLGSTFKAASITLNEDSVMNVFRSNSKISGPFVMNDATTLFIYSDVNSEPNLEVESTTVKGTSQIKLQGPSQILLNNTKNGITFTDSSSIVAVNAYQVQITGPMTLSGSNEISLTNSSLYLDVLSLSSQSSINIVGSTLSILQKNPMTFSPKSASFVNSVFTYKSNCNVNSPINIENSIFNFNYTTTLNSQFNGKNVQFYLDNANFNLGSTGKFSCQSCDFGLRNSIMNFDSFTNNGEFKLYSSSIQTNSDIVSSNGNVYGYYGNFSKGIVMESGSLGIMEERTRLFIDGNVVIKENATIKLYLNSPMDYSWLNISGSLDTHSIEIYFYIELTDNTTMEIIKANKGFVTPLNSENVKLYIYDPDNEEYNKTNSCQYSLQFTETSVIVGTDYSCEDVLISEGKSGLSKGALAGISVGMIALAAGVSFAVWLKTRKTSSQKSQSYQKKELNSVKSDQNNSIA
ncbi:hypothetical protein DICPUDRAFT_152562 [Dictyostelium purpureum]|uniref:Auto-transporter adhesin head GIN domain-containing protein n=1 Tax=Dictyostelium purpureum TaxID=5786 RepID=F0ZLP6_DICPU|nr:uncharacterized protein DICPUDRAFT_152562 [Dictyostelium purpureum]EGC35150.1 hypothetical protein DICPUDRAFT_152562 [Dictyostelium purpureum]|eukprot:XP_003288343.1 hypothetical protein DICPUDRAFT_152562 [Dictyostelium purpureum]